MQELSKKYGLTTAIAMVVGIVIGSGVFFKAEKILSLTGGSLPLALLAWGIGGLIMIVCAYTFAILATRHSRVNGIVDYAESALGKDYGFLVGWFMAVIYYPTLASVLSWISARYMGVLLGWEIASGNVMMLAGFFLICSFTVNALSPILAGKLQVVATVIKLIPLILTAIVGTIKGLINGVTISNFKNVVYEVNTSSALFSAVCATAFAYDGWIVATSINSELKNAKKNLPRALVGGTIIVMVVYMLYYVGLAGGLSNKEMIELGENGAKQAFSNIFGGFAGVGLMVFVVISCLGTLNGLMLGGARGMYSLAVRNTGIKPTVFKEINKQTNMPLPSAVLGLLFSAMWLFYFYGANLVDKPWFGVFSFDSSELPIVTVYGFYIPIFIMLMIKEKGLNIFNRFIMPCLAIIGCVIVIIASIVSHGIDNVYYLIVFFAIMITGYLILKLYNKDKNISKMLKEEKEYEIVSEK